MRNEHTIGILKGQWASLQGLRLALHTPNDMLHVIKWVNACITLHNMLAQLGDAWDELHGDVGLAGPQRVSDSTPPEGAEVLRSEVQNRCLAINRANHTLPIPR